MEDHALTTGPVGTAQQLEKAGEAIDAAARRYEGIDQWGPIKRIDTE